MTIFKEARQGNPTWYNGLGANEPVQAIGNWLRQDLGPGHKIVVMTDDIHHLRAQKTLENEKAVCLYIVLMILVRMCLIDRPRKEAHG